MNRDPIAELEKIRLEQQELRIRLREMDDRIADLRLSLAEKGEAEAINPAQIPPPVPEMFTQPAVPKASVVPPPIPPMSGEKEDSGIPQIIDLPTAFDPIDPPLQPQSDARPSPILFSEPAPAVETATPESPGEKESFEVRVGRYWLVRVGILMLLTALVALAGYTYTNVIAKFGAPGKLALLYLAAGLLAGVGMWLGRKAPHMRNYSNVLLSGGIAIAYYATYAAHFVNQLRVIDSPLIGGLVLLGFAGLLVWTADRFRSQTVAFLAILLSYFTSAINPQAGFTVVSSLILTIAALVLLARRGWMPLSYLSLAGTYLSFAYWQFVQTGRILPGGLPQELAFSSCAALACYWVLFTGMVFVRQRSSFGRAELGTFLTINNGAFFGLTAPLLASILQENFWLFPLGFGAVLLGLSRLARRNAPDEKSVEGAWVTQGLLLITVAFILHWIGGYELAIVLAIESGFLLTRSRGRNGLICGVGSALTGAGSFALASLELWKFGDTTAKLTALFVAAVFLVSAGLFKWQRSSFGKFQAAAAYVIPALLLAGQLIVHQWDVPFLIDALAIAAVCATLSIYLLRMPEIPTFGQGFLVLAYPCWFFARHDSAQWPEVATLIVASLAMIHWWQGQKRIILPRALLLTGQTLYSLGIAVLLFDWLPPQFNPENWMLLCGGLGVLILSYGLLTKTGPLAAISLLFTSSSVCSYFVLHAKGDPGWAQSLLTIGLFAVQPTLIRKIGWPAEVPKGSLIWRLLTAAMALVFVGTYSEAQWQFTAFMALSAIVFLVGALKKSREWLIYAGIYAVIALVSFWARQMIGKPVFWPDLAGLLLLLGMQQAGKRLLVGTKFFPSELQGVTIAAGIVSLWIFVTRLYWHGEGPSLTIAWSVLAFVVMAAGFLLREKLYRHLALALIALCVGKILLVDVWTMNKLTGILSCLFASIVILVLGYFYNRFAPLWKKWF